MKPQIVVVKAAESTCWPWDSKPYLDLQWPGRKFYSR